ESWGLVWLDEIEIEIAWWHRCGSLIGRSKEQVSPTRSLALAPLQLMLPNAIAANISLVRALHHSSQRIVVISIESHCVEALGALLNQRIKVVSFFQIEVILLIIPIRGNELPAYRSVNFSQHCLDL